jgi:hypothetical protein
MTLLGYVPRLIDEQIDPPHAATRADFKTR